MVLFVKLKLKIMSCPPMAEEISRTTRKARQGNYSDLGGNGDKTKKAISPCCLHEIYIRDSHGLKQQDCTVEEHTRVLQPSTKDWIE